MSNYCAEADLVLIYGQKNINRWADLDNDEDNYVIDARIEWACEFATEFVNSRLLRGPYAVPFDSPYPLLIVNLTAMYAGILLYDGRQVVSAEDNDKVSRQRRDFDRYIRQIFKGQLKLFTTTGTAISLASECTPFVVVDETEDTTSTLDDVIY